MVRLETPPRPPTAASAGRSSQFVRAALSVLQQRQHQQLPGGGLRNGCRGSRGHYQRVRQQQQNQDTGPSVNLVGSVGETELCSDSLRSLYAGGCSFNDSSTADGAAAVDRVAVACERHVRLQASSKQVQEALHSASSLNGGLERGNCTVAQPLSQYPQQRVLQQQQLAFFQPQQHPHDQHARHGTYGIVARGVRERTGGKSEVEATAVAAATAAAGGAGAGAGTAAAGRRSKQYRTALLQKLRDDRPYVCFSCKYRDNFLTLSTDRLEVTGHKGWSSVFVTHCAEKGRWYFEIEVLPPETNKLRFLGYTADNPPPVVRPHWRVGWACRYQRYDLPIGSSSNSFALADTEAGLQLITDGIKRPLPIADNVDVFLEPKVGDVIGCFLVLLEPKWWQPDPRKDHKLYEFIQAGILCNPEEPPQVVVDEGAWIEFAINGNRLGSSFRGEIGNGAYHPAVSLYMGAKLRFNPGPQFSFPPGRAEHFQPCSEMRRPYIL